MSKQEVEQARRGYEALNSVYETGDVDDLLSFAKQMWWPDLVLKTSGSWPDSGEWHGYDGLLKFVGDQMEAFSEMWIDPYELIDAGEKVVAFVRLGGKARHTGIEAEFSVAHVWTMRDGKADRVDMYERRSEALAAAGIER
jgi:ketosteroid isomerase-like protein